MHNNDFSELTTVKANENHREYLNRLNFYRAVGLDNEKEREVIGNLINFNPQSVLEIGTGKGVLTTYLAKQCDNVVTIDIDEDTQRIAKLNALYADVHKKIDFIIADAVNLPFKDNNFDLVISAFAFHHIDDPQAVFNEMIRVSNKYIIISEFNERGFDIIRKAHGIENRTHEEKHTDLASFINMIAKPCLEITENAALNQYIYTIEKRSI